MTTTLRSACLLAVLLTSGSLTAAQPADPDLIPEASKLLDYLESIRGRKILTAISGSQDAQTQAVLHITGREPAISGHDVAGFHRKWEATYRKVLQGTVDEAIRWWREKGGIVTLHYHWMKPGNPVGSAWVSGGRAARAIHPSGCAGPSTTRTC
jgi:hypothetical protein